MWNYDVESIPYNVKIIVVYYGLSKVFVAEREPKENLVPHAANYNMCISTQEGTLVCLDNVICWTELPDIGEQT